MIWKILGIEKTKDKDVITRAYRELLSTVNPEEKPEEFKRLRTSYEEALEYARKEEEESADDDISLWVKDLEEIYNSLQRRIDINEWKELLAKDVCVGLDTKHLVEDAMLKFFYQNYHLPHNIWLLLNDEFAFKDRVEELYEIHPQDFINYVVLEGIDYEDNFPLEFFNPGFDGKVCDEYISTYFKLQRAAIDESKELIEMLKNMEEHHPYGDSLLLRFRSYDKDKTAINELEEIVKEYPNDRHLNTELAFMYLRFEMFNEAKNLSSKLMEEFGEDSVLLDLNAHALAGLEEYEEAIEVLFKEMRLSGGDDKRLYELDNVYTEWNNKVLEKYLKKREENPTDRKNNYDLAWSYLQNRELEKAYELLPDLDDETPTILKAKRLKCTIHAVLEHDDEAINLCDEIVKMIDNKEYSEDDTEEQVERYRIGALIEKARILLRLKRNDEATMCLDNVTVIAHNNGTALSDIWKMYMYLQLQSKALDVAYQLVNLSPNTAHPHMCAAEAAFYLHRDNEAFSEVNTALSLDGSNLQAYELKLRILVRNNAFDQAKELINFLKENGVDDDKLVIWQEALMRRAESEQDIDEEILEVYKGIDEFFSKEEDNYMPEWLHDFYFEYTCLVADIKDKNKSGFAPDELLEILEKGIKVIPEAYSCREYKAWILGRQKKTSEAIKIYHELEKMERGNRYVESQLAYLYGTDSYHNSDIALKYYNMVYDEKKNQTDYLQRLSFFNTLCGNYEEGERVIREAIELNPEYDWGYHRLAQCFIDQRRFEEGLEAEKKALEIYKARLPEKKEDRIDTYWNFLAEIYLLLNRPNDAVKVYRELRENCPDYKTFFRDAYMAFYSANRVNDLELLVNEWTKAKEDKPGLLYYKVRRLMTEGKEKEAIKSFRWNSSNMLPEDSAELKIYVSEMKLDFEPEMKRAKDSAEKLFKENPDTNCCYEYANYAYNLFRLERFDDAKLWAKRAIESFEKNKGYFGTAKPVNIGSSAIALALLGKFDEARERVEKMNTAPLCRGCKYHICKDYYMYLAKIEIVAGNIDLAKNYIDTMYKSDLSEESVIRLKAYLKKKGYN